MTLNVYHLLFNYCNKFPVADGEILGNIMAEIITLIVGNYFGPLLLECIQNKKKTLIIKSIRSVHQGKEDID